MKELKVCLTGGATGGHLYPLVFVARELKKLANQNGLKLDLCYLGVKPIDPEILKEEGIKIYSLPQIKLRRYFDFQNLIDLIKLPFAFLTALIKMFFLMPDVLFSKGGPTSLLVVISAWIFRIPIIIHDSDSIPGLTNKLSARFAQKIALAFPSAQKYFPPSKTIVVGQPIDERILFTPIYESDYERFGLNPEEKIILILGGSQGSEFINDLTLNMLPEILKDGQVVHLTGKKFFKEYYFYAERKIERTAFNFKERYKCFPFLKNEDLLILMKMSHLIISRAGSSTIFEICALGKPSILIPLPEEIVGSHQKENAYALQAQGGCYVLEEPNAKPHIVLNLIQTILNDPELQERLSRSAANFYLPNSARKIAEQIILLSKLS